MLRFDIFSPEQNGFEHFQMHFFRGKVYFDSNFTEVYFWWSHWQYVIIGSGNGLAPNICQSNTRGTDTHIHALQASLCLYWSQCELTKDCPTIHHDHWKPRVVIMPTLLSWEQSWHYNNSWFSVMSVLDSFTVSLHSLCMTLACAGGLSVASEKQWKFPPVMSTHNALWLQFYIDIAPVYT